MANEGAKRPTREPVVDPNWRKIGFVFREPRDPTRKGTLRKDVEYRECARAAAMLFVSISDKIGESEARLIFQAVLVRPKGRKPLDGGRKTLDDEFFLSFCEWTKANNPRMSDRMFAREYLNNYGPRRAPTETDILAVTKRLQRIRKAPVASNATPEERAPKPWRRRTE
jgi:hypothetical protein